jgi:membrane-bound lytic murein transglycosylase D
MLETKPFFPLLEPITRPLSTLALILLLSACAVPAPQHESELTLTPGDIDTLAQATQSSEKTGVDASVLAEQEAESSGDNGNDADSPVVALLDSDLVSPDPEHSTLDSGDEPAAVIDVLPDLEARLSRMVTDTAGEQQSPDADQPEIATNLWDRLRSHFRLQDSEHLRTLAEKRWYASHQAYINRTIDRARPYLYLIAEEAEKQDIPAELVLLPIVESAFQPFAYSHGRAAGIWQFIPSTGRIFGLKQNWWYDGRRDIEASTRAAFTYLSNLKDSFDGDWLLALAAYNSGQGTVKKAIRHNRRRGRPTDFWSLQLPRETRAYVPKLLAIRAIVEDPKQYGINLPPVANEPYLAKVDTGTQIDLALAAELAGISIDDLYILNPAFNRWATAPNGPHTLLLPTDKAETFSEKLAEVPKSRRIKWARHRIRNGENLGLIAKRYHTTVSMLRKINNLRGNMIRAGHSLIIPVATKRMNSYTLSAMQRTRAIQNAPKGGHKTRYTVRRGDTLWDIARAHKVSVRTLARWNGMATRDLLRPGQTLVIWQHGSTLATTRRINYVVRRGDSLSRISQRFNVKVSELRRWNGLHKNKYLQPGQRLTLYVDVTQQAENI